MISVKARATQTNAAVVAGLVGGHPVLFGRHADMLIREGFG